MSSCVTENKASVSDTKVVNKYQELDLAYKALKTQRKLKKEAEIAEANTFLEENVLPILIEAVKQGKGIIICEYVSFDISDCDDHRYWKMVRVPGNVFNRMYETKFMEELRGKVGFFAKSRDSMDIMYVDIVNI